MLGGSIDGWCVPARAEGLRPSEAVRGGAESRAVCGVSIDAGVDEI